MLASFGFSTIPSKLRAIVKVTLGRVVISFPFGNRTVPGGAGGSQTRGGLKSKTIVRYPNISLYSLLFFAILPLGRGFILAFSKKGC
jgi:hypothetical protein